MYMATSEKTLRLIVFALVVLASGALVYATWLVLPLVQEQPVTSPQRTDYAPSFYNRQGQQLSSQTGSLALLLNPFGFYVNYPDQQTQRFRIDGNGCRHSGRRGERQQLAVVLGGSTAFGQDLASDRETFSSVLNTLGLDYYFYNCAVVGYASGQELALMVHRLDRMQPVLYILFHGWNDIYSPLNLARSWPVRFPSIGYNGQFSVLESRLRKYWEIEEKPGAATGDMLRPVTHVLDRDQLVSAILENYVSNVEKMRDFAAARGADLMIVLQPDLGLKPLRTEEEEDIIRNWGKRTRYLSNHISAAYRQFLDSAKRRLAEKGIRYIDINESPWFVDTGSTLFLDPVHLNAEGHRLVAEQIGASLQRQPPRHPPVSRPAPDA
jgi:hypothetical protein